MLFFYFGNSAADGLGGREGRPQSHDEQKPHVQIFNLLALKLWSCFAHKWTDRRYLMWSIIFSDF